MEELMLPNIKKLVKSMQNKTMIFTDLAETGIPSNAIREVSLLKELDHPNIIKVEEVIYWRPKLHLIMEYMDTDLKKYIPYSIQSPCMGESWSLKNVQQIFFVKNYTFELYVN